MILADKSKICKADVPVCTLLGRRIFFYLGEGSAFCSVQACNRLDEAHPIYGGQAAITKAEGTGVYEKAPENNDRERDGAKLRME